MRAPCEHGAASCPARTHGANFGSCAAEPGLSVAAGLESCCASCQVRAGLGGVVPALQAGKLRHGATAASWGHGTKLELSPGSVPVQPALD